MNKRFEWPKEVPLLSPAQQIISNDFIRYWHDILPHAYTNIEYFNHTYVLKHLPCQKYFKTLEIGAGTGTHIAMENLGRQEYHALELRENMAEAIIKKYCTVKVHIGDCQVMPFYESNSFDRVIAIHVLEHLPNLPNCIKEVWQILKPGGIFSIVIPCDPGLAYSLARKVSAERIFKRRYKQSYKWFIEREHLNSPAEILHLLGCFKEIDRVYWPLRVPIINLNLCIGITLKKI